MVRDSGGFSKEAEVEDTGEQADVADGADQHARRVRPVGEGAGVEESAGLGGLDTHLHYEDGDEEGGEDGEAEDADAPAEADLINEPAESVSKRSVSAQPRPLTCRT